jgi:transposase
VLSAGDPSINPIEVEGRSMIVIGVDAHSQTHTAAAVDGLTAALIEDRTVPARRAGNTTLLNWGRGLDAERVWALEDCRNMTSSLERLLLLADERVSRVPPKLMASQRKAARSFGKSDPIDALAVARAALREPNLPQARLAGPTREIKLLADHRDDLVEENTRYQRRLRWHLHELDPELQPPLRCLALPANLERLRRRLAVMPQTAQVRICRELLRRIRELQRRAAELKRQLHKLVKRHCPALLELCGCGTLMAARILAEIDDISRFHNERQLAAYAGVSPLDASSGRQQRHRLNRTGNRRLNRALHIIAVTQIRVHQPARDYMARRISEGKTTREALRALKRYIARRLYRTLTDAAARKRPAAPGDAPLACIT